MIASLAPIALYLLVLQVFDAFSMARWRKLAGSLLWGMLSAGCTLGVVYIYRNTIDETGWSHVAVSPILEEIIKAFPLCILVMRRKVVFFAETQIYGQMVGGGFALVENVLYAIANPQMSVGSALVRGFGTSLLHMGCTAMVASMVLMLMRKSYLIPLAFVPSIAIHIFYNMQLLDPLKQLLLIVVFFFCAFYIIARVGEKMILTWMDVSVQNDVSLLAALKEGKLLDTPAGMYMQSIRERFEPMQFFDMCVYVQLYLELLMEGKSRIMLRDAGLEIPYTPEQKAEHKEKLAELDALASRISLLGHHLLRPILHTSNQNLWAIRN